MALTWPGPLGTRREWHSERDAFLRGESAVVLGCCQILGAIEILVGTISVPFFSSVKACHPVCFRDRFSTWQCMPHCAVSHGHVSHSVTSCHIVVLTISDSSSCVQNLIV